MSFRDHSGVQLRPDEHQPAPILVAWKDYSALMRAVARDPGSPDLEGQLRLTYVLIDHADRAGVSSEAL